MVSIVMNSLYRKQNNEYTKQTLSFISEKISLQHIVQGLCYMHLHNIELPIMRTLTGNLQQSSDLFLIQPLGVPLTLYNFTNLNEPKVIRLHLETV